MFRKLIAISILASSVVLSACSGSNSDDENDSNPTTVAIQGIAQIDAPAASPGVGNSVYDNIFNNTDLSILLEAIDAAELANVLDNEASEFTVFAPDNAAFQKLEDSNPDDEIIVALFANPAALVSVLEFHILRGVTTEADAIAASPADLTTVNGNAVFLGPSDFSPSGLAFGGADIAIPDSDYLPDSSVGVVHVINSVLLPD